MNFEQLLNLSAEEELFPLKKDHSLKEEILELLPEEVHPQPCMSFLDILNEKEELMSYLDCLDLPITAPALNQLMEDSKDDNGLESKIQEVEKMTSVPKEKKGKKVENSPFHNYQKHLNNALKKLVILPHLSSSDEEFKLAARDIWGVYVSGQVKTKKILHFVFNEKNEHSINEGQLRAYGLLEVYQQYDMAVISRAKNYLSRLAVDQIDEENIDLYIKSRKMKKTEGFKDYILNFRKELEGGFIKRRVHFQ